MTPVVPLTAEYAEQVLAIYQAGIDEGNATFETEAPVWAAFDAAKLPGHRFAALDRAGAVLGWVAASPVSDREWSSTPSTSTRRPAAGGSPPRCSRSPAIG